MGIYILIIILLYTPLWIFAIPLLILAATSIGFWRRKRLRNACAALAFLVGLMAVPFVIVQAAFYTSPTERIESGFGVAVDRSSIAKYQFKLAGLGDTVEFWRLRKCNAGVCEQIIHKHGLEMIGSDKTYLPGSVVLSHPWWWPRSTQGYSIFQGNDSEGGSMEVWISQDGSRFYLYRFLE